MEFWKKKNTFHRALYIDCICIKCMWIYVKVWIKALFSVSACFWIKSYVLYIQEHAQTENRTFIHYIPLFSKVTYTVHKVHTFRLELNVGDTWAQVYKTFSLNGKFDRYFRLFLNVIMWLKHKCNCQHKCKCQQCISVQVDLNVCVLNAYIYIFINMHKYDFCPHMMKLLES